MEVFPDPELIATIDQVLREVDPLPNNEAATVEWIIRPLMARLGYSPRELHPQMTNGAGGRPDYVILPGSEFEFYLEAKSANESLDDIRHISQALTYAYQAFDGKRRWVILSNGLEWRLYDARMEAPVPERLVAETRLEKTTHALRFFHAIRRESVVGGALVRFATEERARREQDARNRKLVGRLQADLLDQESTCFIALHRALTNLREPPDVTRDELLAVLRELLDPPESADEPEGHAVVGSPRGTSTERPIAIAESRGPMVRLDVLAVQVSRVTHNKPTSIRFPDNSARSVSSWAELARAIVQWLGKADRLPSLPLRTGRGSCFLHVVPQHEVVPMRSPETFQFGSRTVYMELNCSAKDYVRQLHLLVIEAGFEASSFVVHLRR